MKPETLNRINEWKEKVTIDYLKEELNSLSNDELDDAFYTDIEFGTGGLRAKLGVGPNRLNLYTIRKATQGLANYLNKHYKNAAVAISRDTRHFSYEFAHETASVLVANGIKVYIYSDPMPTPTLSFATRYLKCQAGVMITASHNSKEYNGYKVYDDNGCQITNNAADEILAYINATDTFTGFKCADFDENVRKGNIAYISEDLINDLFKYELSLSKEINTPKSLVITYTPLNGTGKRCVTTVLGLAGYKNVNVVKEQADFNGDFPTTPLPNPEFLKTLELGIKESLNTNSDILLATDPDCDRVGVAVFDKGEMKQLSGNQVGVLLFDYLLNFNKSKNPVVVKTIVTTDLVTSIAKKHNVEVRNVLTGFKYIGEQIADLAKNNRIDDYLLGFEESCGYLSGTESRDKDAVNACLIIADMANFYKKQGKTLIDRYSELEKEYGYTETSLQSFFFEGSDGMNKMAKIMDNLRNNPIKKPIIIEDYLFSKRFINGETEVINLPVSNVLKYFYDDGTSITIRPSGTEPKLKAYVFSTDKDKDNLTKKMKEINEHIASLFGK